MTADPACYPMAAFVGEERMNSVKLQQILNINITPVVFFKKKLKRGGLASTNRDVWSTHLDLNISTSLWTDLKRAVTAQGFDTAQDCCKILTTQTFAVDCFRFCLSEKMELCILFT